MRFYFPYGLRPSRVEERKKFYQDEFEIEKAEKWFKISGVLIVDVGSETTRYRPVLKKYLNKLVYIRKYDNLEHLREKIIYYCPEDLYYQFKFPEHGILKQELIFDLDPENVNCVKCSLLRKNIQGIGKTYSFCENCFKETAERTKELYILIKKHFEDVKLVYSGRGFHIHVRDKIAFDLEENKRKELSNKIKKKFPIDEWVTSGNIDIVRLPFSLNGLVSRKVIEIELKDLNNLEKLVNEKALPEFLK